MEHVEGNPPTTTMTIIKLKITVNELKLFSMIFMLITLSFDEMKWLSVVFCFSSCSLSDITITQAAYIIFHFNVFNVFLWRFIRDVEVFFKIKFFFSPGPSTNGNEFIEVINWNNGSFMLVFCVCVVLLFCNICYFSLFQIYYHHWYEIKCKSVHSINHQESRVFLLLSLFLHQQL